ncbi:cytochrome c oxidase assembly protein [Alteromonas sp. KUL42]|uniref:cytochrome c oxidase assembly protein n=1 Tax=Alteromonas sp. KUL42 TaxID=2480797 RepID=UPI00079897C7|nr:cytochrome c oxidase assembly protein [Alteromonas sp. KUL42]KXJ62037.1 MAG: cytochrome C oxidase assembly protein [Alteromonas sp. Nap_26]TAP32359.1 cytochrome c oxidase assembly protein [Alteromonas sp. KUL42]GEA08784.1 cytochrome c oxidase assembly protein [Alteromonas sp. KUL42]
MSQQSANNKMVLKLIVIVIGMFGFGFALVPLYDVFCDVAGINGKTDKTAAVYSSVEIDESREVTVEFITRTNTGMPWEFRAETKRVKVHPGELNTVSFYVRNPASSNIVAQAIPSVSPGTAALYLNKTECFCFNQQPLDAGSEAYMPMQFYVDPQIPQEITYLTLQYTLYDVTARASDLTTKPNPFMVNSAESGK